MTYVLGVLCHYNKKLHFNLASSFSILFIENLQKFILVGKFCLSFYEQVYAT